MGLRRAAAPPRICASVSSLSGLSTSFAMFDMCLACHQEPHRGMEDFFRGSHGNLPCRSCHKIETGQFPAGQGTAVRFKVGRTCRSCHPQF